MTRRRQCHGQLRFHCNGWSQHQTPGGPITVTECDKTCHCVDHADPASKTLNCPTISLRCQKSKLAATLDIVTPEGAPAWAAAAVGTPPARAAPLAAAPPAVRAALARPKRPAGARCRRQRVARRGSHLCSVATWDSPATHRRGQLLRRNLHRRPRRGLCRRCRCRRRPPPPAPAPPLSPPVGPGTSFAAACSAPWPAAAAALQLRR